MTKREREIVEILRKNPMISQNDLSNKLGISRSSAAVHITNLMKKGIILGKGYVINEENFVAVIGGANMDIFGFPILDYIERDSNPGYVIQSVGGVGRNIAENLARLGVNTRFFSLVGEDLNGQIILEKTHESGVDISNVKKVKEHPSGVYLSVQDENGDMKSAISQMSIYDTMDESYFESVMKIIEAGSKIVLDTNISQRALTYISYKISGKQIYLDPVSVNKAKRAKNILNNVYCIKPNKLESEALTGIKINSIDTLKQSGDYYLNKGVKQVFISLGKEGLYVRDEHHEGIVESMDIPVINSNGSGDALLAGIILESGRTDDIREIAKCGMSGAQLALGTKETINRNINADIIRDFIKENKIVWKDI